MNNAPAVYVPTQPEGNGLTLPTLLSLLAHCIVLGILIYTYQQPELEIAGSIETTMVTPGELAEIQGQILANRAASAEQAASASSSASAEAQANVSDSSDTNQNSTQQSSQQVPVFTRSDEPVTASSRPLLMSEEQHQQRLEQMAEYNRNIADAAAALDGTQALEAFQQQQRDELIEEQKELKDFRTKSNNQPRVNKPTRSERNINIDLGGSGNAGKTFDLADGQSTVTGGSSFGTSNKSSGGSRGASNSEIVNLIRRHYNPPIGAKGSTQRTTLSITVSANGDIVSVSASGSNEAVNEAAKQAVRNAGRLPIDADDPKYPTFTIQFNGSN